MYEWFNEYCMAKPGVTRDFKAEWGWYRYFVGGKFFAAAGRNEEGEIFFLTLRCEPDFNQFLRQNFQAIAPGFYSNKELWNTVWFSLEQIPERDRLPSAPPLFPPDGPALLPGDCLLFLPSVFPLQLPVLSIPNSCIHK